VIGVGSIDYVEDFADSVLELLTGYLLGLNFFFGFLFGTEHGSKETWFPILRHGCGSPGVEGPACLAWISCCLVLSSNGGYSYELLCSYSSMLAVIARMCKVLSVTQVASKRSPGFRVLLHWF